MKAGRGLTVERMVELGRVSRASFYRFDESTNPGQDADMDLRDAIQRIALEWPSYGRPRITAELRRRDLPMLDPDPAGRFRVVSAMPPEPYEAAVGRAVERIRAG